MTHNVLFSAGAELPIKVDWTDWLAGASIVASTVTVPAEVTKASESTAGAVQTANVKFTAPAERKEGERFEVAFTVTTNESPARKDTRLVVLQVARRYADVV